MWRIFEFDFDGIKIRLMTDRPLSNERVKEIFKKGSIDIDFFEEYGLDLTIGINIVKACYSYETKEQAEKALEEMR